MKTYGRDVYIYDAIRTPRGRGKEGGALANRRPVELGKLTLEALQAKHQLDTSMIEDVILGIVTQTGEQGGCLAKAVAMYAGYHEKVSGVTLNRFCGSGLEAINQAAARISSGYQETLIAGGIESMSRVPMGSDQGPWMCDPDVVKKTDFVPQGISADLIASLNGYTRQDLDQFAVESQQKAAKAIEEKRFTSIIPVGEVIQDEFPRPDTTVEGLAKLNPSFEKWGIEKGFDAIALKKYPQLKSINHVHHPGNSSGIVDGAAVALLGSENLKAKGLKPRARIVATALTSTEPTIMLTGPAPASKLALQRAGMNLSDIDLIEVNEAFASVVLHFIDEMKADREKINVNGGAIALGHPLGATGCMLVGTCLDELERRGLSTGLITLCIGGGMGIATIIERL